MSQEARVNMECTTCKRVVHFTRKNKKIHKSRLELSKYCRFCNKHTINKETK